MPCLRFRPAHQAGAALVVAMLVMALSAALVVSMRSEFMLFYQRGSNNYVSEQAYAFLRGGEEIASYMLVQDYDRDASSDTPRDTTFEEWAQQAEPLPLEDVGWLKGQLEDLQGRFNINLLVQRGSDDGEKFTVPQQQFIRLLQALPDLQISEYEAINLTRAIGDWLDRDSVPSSGGAEDDYYYSQTPAYRAANQPMVSVSELMLVANMTPEIFEALAPHVSVWPQDGGKLNIHTATSVVLRTINEDGNLQPLGEAEAQELFTLREESGYADLDSFLAQPAFAGKTLDETRNYLTETSNFFLMSAVAEVAEREVRLYSVLQRNGRNIIALTRTSGSP